MPNIDTGPIKEKIVSFLRAKGPSLPVHIAKETNQSILFASAFLSELVAEKKVKLSHMKVVSSPLYLIPGQEENLEKYSNHLKSKEKDAYQLLKEKNTLKDKELDPAIRVALRSIKDFAVPFEKSGELHWRYFTIKDGETKKVDQKTIIKPDNEKVEIKSTTTSKEEKQDKPKVTRKPKKTTKKKSKKEEKFYNQVKDYLDNKKIILKDIIGFSKTEMTIKVQEESGDKLIIAFNKKRVDEKDIIKAHKIASELNMKYTILALGEPAKKTTNFINAIRDLKSLEKIK
jgi:hypothetical protein